jgi:hypothetical protein
MHLFEKDSDHHDQIAIIWSDLATIAADKHSSREAHQCMALAIAEMQRAANSNPDETSALLTTQARMMLKSTATLVPQSLSISTLWISGRNLMETSIPTLDGFMCFLAAPTWRPATLLPPAR